MGAWVGRAWGEGRVGGGVHAPPTPTPSPTKLSETPHPHPPPLKEMVPYVATKQLKKIAFNRNMKMGSYVGQYKHVLLL